MTEITTPVINLLINIVMYSSIVMLPILIIIKIVNIFISMVIGKVKL